MLEFTDIECKNFIIESPKIESHMIYIDKKPYKTVSINLLKEGKIFKIFSHLTEKEVQCLIKQLKEMTIEQAKELKFDTEYNPYYFKQESYNDYIKILARNKDEAVRSGNRQFPNVKYIGDFEEFKKAIYNDMKEESEKGKLEDVELICF